jgi:hypothetical protein
MSKVIKPAQHGILDYALAFLFLLAPSIFNFPDNAATLSYVVGVAYLGTSLITRYPLGVWKVLPFPTHGVIESVMAAAWVVAPWLFGFSGHDAARNFFVIAGVGLLLVVALTDYKSRAAATQTRLGHA